MPIIALLEAGLLIGFGNKVEILSKNGCPLTADAANGLILTWGAMKSTERVDTTKTPK